MVVDCRDAEQAGDWRPVLVDTPVAQNQELVPVLDGLRSLSAEIIHRSSEPVRTFSHPEQHPQGLALEVRVGCLTLIRRQASGVSAITFGLGPILVTSDMTSSSRIGSIGGLVTWANSCLKYLNRSCGRSESTAIGVSVPIEETGSSPATTI